MRNPFRDIVLVITTALIVAAGVFAVRPAGAIPDSQAAEPRRTPDGKPDLSGIWQTNSTANWDLLTHETRPMVAQPGVYPDVPVLAAPVVALGTLGWIPPGTGVVEGDEIPYQPWAAQRKRENAANWLDRDPELKCYMPGVPRAMYLPYPFQIVQGTNKIMMIFEFANAQRTINLDAVEPYPGDAYMGYSIGRWQGDTLVVDVSNFTPYTWFDRAGDFHSDALRVVERYTPISRDAIRYEATIEDSKVFTRPWKITVPLYRRLEPDAQVLDFRCIEQVEETIYGHLRKKPLVTHWEGRTMNVDITRKIPPGEDVYQRQWSGNPEDSEQK
jgi:hypothetical protein